MNRRTFFQAGIAAVTAASALAAPPPASAFGITETGLHPCKDTLAFLEFAHGLGAAGIQATLSSLDAEYLRRLRARAEALGMYLEVWASLDAMEHVAPAASAVGALAIRAVGPGARRYERFATHQEWKTAEARARDAIARAIPVAEHSRVPIALDNHRDRTRDEILLLLKEFGGDYFGVTLDTGNNIALLDDPMEVIERLAPYAFSTHIKDPGVEEYADGFLLSEAPLGQGMLDFKKVFNVIRAARPKVKFTVEMITRNPTPVACFTDKYWAAMPDRPGRFLGRTMRLVREKGKKQRRMDGLDQAAQVRLEEEDWRACLGYGA